MTLALICAVQATAAAILGQRYRALEPLAFVFLAASVVVTFVNQVLVP